MIKFAIKILFLSIILYSSVFAQNVNEQRYRLAESYEQNGDFPGALRIYSDLIKEDSKSDEYFEAYSRVMKQLNNYSDLLKAVRDRLANKESLELLDLYAEMNWRAGNPEEANKTWEKVLDKFESAQAAYFHVSQTQINLRLFEKAISTLIRGRKNINDSRLFNDPLIKLYIAVGDYRNGTKEIFNMLNMDYNIPQAQGRLFALMINEEANAYIGDELNRISSDNSNNIYYHEVYSWYLRTTGKTDEALNLVVKIDRLKNAKGLDILNFASTASHDGNYETAIKAFKIVIEQGKNSPYTSSALFGFTKALEDKMNMNKGKITPKAAEEIIDSYRRIISDFPKTSNAADSRLRLAQIYSEILKDNKKAIAELEKLISEFTNSHYAVTAYLELGKIYIMNDDLENAENSFAKFDTALRFSNADQKDQIMYYKALLLYFKGDIKNAQKAFEVLVLNPDTDIANDVMKKLYNITSNEQYIAALELFAKAELREFQKNPKEALEILKEVIKLADKTPLGETATYKAAEIEFNNAEYLECRKYLTSISQKYPESKNNDKYIFLTAESYYSEDNSGEALKFYTELITKYPESIYLQESRKKIRIIRKDKI
jgi:tetratricopeptide (TPR) repeat protein